METSEQGFCVYCQKTTLQEVAKTQVSRITVKVEATCAVCRHTVSMRCITGVIITTTEGDEVFQGYKGWG